MGKITRFIARGILGFFSLVFSILSLPPVRDLLWGKITKKAKEKIVDAEHKVVDSQGAEVDAKPTKKKKRKLFG